MSIQLIQRGLYPNEWLLSGLNAKLVELVTMAPVKAQIRPGRHYTDVY